MTFIGVTVFVVPKAAVVVNISHLSAATLVGGKGPGMLMIRYSIGREEVRRGLGYFNSSSDTLLRFQFLFCGVFVSEV
jgi:hypothetical protein